MSHYTHCVLRQCTHVHPVHRMHTLHMSTAYCTLHTTYICTGTVHTYRHCTHILQLDIVHCTPMTNVFIHSTTHVHTICTDDCTHPTHVPTTCIDDHTHHIHVHSIPVDLSHASDMVAWSCIVITGIHDHTTILPYQTTIHSIATF